MMIKKIVALLNNKKAFTLIESIIAISIIGVIGIIMADILSRTFDNNEKTNLLSNVQQNGQTTLSLLDDAIRNSQFVCLGGYDAEGIARVPNQANVEYFNPYFVMTRNGRYVRYQIVTETSQQNGYINEDYPVSDSSQKLADMFCNPSSTEPAFVPVSTQTYSQKLTNNTALSVKRGSITLLSAPVSSLDSRGTSKIAVTLFFTIGPTKDAPVSAERSIGNNNEIEFKTTTQFR